MISVTIGSSVYSPAMQRWDGELKDLYNSFTQIDSKFSLKKVRQPFFCATPDYEPLYKDEVNLKKNATYPLIIIDGDAGVDGSVLPNEKKIHNYMKTLGYNHFIISSWSKNVNFTKWRLVIEANGVTVNSLENTARSVVADMQKKGIMVAYAYENHTPSRAWFFGGMESPELFEHFGYFDGKPYERVMKRMQVKECELPEMQQAEKKQKLDEIIEVLKTGSTGYHPAQNKFSWMMASDGVDKSMIKTLLQSFMEDWKDGSDRWVERYDNIEKSVESAYQKLKVKKTSFEKNLELVNKKEKVIADRGCSFKEPPGAINDVKNEFLERMRYPLSQIAIIGALHSVAVFSGNQYRCRGIGLTQKRVLLAKSGVGKNSILSWMNHLVIKAPVGLSNSSDKIKLIGHTDYTSSRVLHLELQEFPVKSIITSEAGKVGKSTAGDLARLGRHYLMILGNNFGDVLLPTGMASSKDNEAMKPLYNLNLQMLSESVPDSYIENMIEQGDISDGNLSRSELIFIDVSKEAPEINYHSDDHEVDKDVLGLYGRLFKRFKRFGNKNPLEYQEKCTEIVLEDDVSIAYGELELFGLIKSRQSDDEFISALWNRRHVKVLKTAMVLSIANSASASECSMDDEMVIPTITMEDWKWAESYQNEICSVLEHKNNQGAFDSIFVTIAADFREKLREIDRNKTYLRLYSEEQRRDGILGGFMLDRLVYRFKPFKNLASTIYRGRKNDAIKGFTQYCCEIQLLQKLDNDEVKRYGMRGSVFKFNI